MASANHRDPRHLEVITVASRVRWCARLWTAAVAVICAIIDGKLWFIGAVLGGLVVEINLGLLLRTLARSVTWQGRSLWPTLLRFYLTFGATILVCFFVIRNHWGHPLAFLAGLLSFFAGLVLALISMVIWKPAPKPGPAGDSAND